MRRLSLAILVAFLAVLLHPQFALAAPLVDGSLLVPTTDSRILMIDPLSVPPTVAEWVDLANLGYPGAAPIDVEVSTHGLVYVLDGVTPQLPDEIIAITADGQFAFSVPHQQLTDSGSLDRAAELAIVGERVFFVSMFHEDDARIIEILPDGSLQVIAYHADLVSPNGQFFPERIVDVEADSTAIYFSSSLGGPYTWSKGAIWSVNVVNYAVEIFPTEYVTCMGYFDGTCIANSSNVLPYAWGLARTSVGTFFTTHGSTSNPQIYLSSPTNAIYDSFGTIADFGANGNIEYDPIVDLLYTKNGNEIVVSGAAGELPSAIPLGNQTRYSMALVRNVPEPSAGLMLAGGVGLLAMLGKRRTKT